MLETRIIGSFGLPAVGSDAVECGLCQACALPRGPALVPGTENSMEEYQKLRQLVEEIADDVFKAMGGNKAAGTRVRKAMQDIKNGAQVVRKKVLEIRDVEAPQGTSGPTS